MIERILTVRWVASTNKQKNKITNAVINMSKYEPCSDNSLSTFRYNLSSPSLGVKGLFGFLTHEDETNRLSPVVS